MKKYKVYELPNDDSNIMDNIELVDISNMTENDLQYYTVHNTLPQAMTQAYNNMQRVLNRSIAIAEDACESYKFSWLSKLTDEELEALPPWMQPDVTKLKETHDTM